MGEEATAEGPEEEASRMTCIYGHVTVPVPDGCRNEGRSVSILGSDNFRPI